MRFDHALEKRNINACYYYYYYEIKPDMLWIALGTGSGFHYIAVHEVVGTMNPRQSKNLQVFHADTGCGTVSSFAPPNAR